MALIRWAPFWPELNEDLWAGDVFNFSPAVDVYEDRENVTVETPLAGIDPEQVSIEIEDNILKISGKAEKKSEVDEKNYYRREIRQGSFYRAVVLPKAVDGNKAAATYDQGILKITVPKREEAKPKTIKVIAKKA